MHRCPGNETVALHVAGALAPERSERVAAHADGCDACRRVIAELARASLDEGAAPPVPAQTTPSTWVYGRYRLRKLIGAGAMGTVWHAYDPALRRDVALKLLRRSGHGPDAIAAVLAEARAMAAVDHPNVVRVFDVGARDGQIFLAMELVRGGTLRRWRSQLGPSRDAIVAAMRHAALGLAAVHAAALVHRDFKPDNVLVEHGASGAPARVMVADFGLAALRTAIDTDEHDATVQTPRLAGTLAYMAPELFASGEPSAASDQFAWAIALCELAWGVRPQGEGPPPAAPPRLARVLARCLRPEPGDRWPDMHAVVAALDRAVSPPRPRAWWLAAAGAIVGATALGGVAPPTPACELDAIAPVLDDARRLAIGTALERTHPDLPPGVAAVLDRVEQSHASWQTQARDACDASARDDGRTEAMRACLRERGLELSRLSSALASSDDATVDAAADHVLGTAALDCREADAQPRVPAALRDAVAQLRVAVWTGHGATAVAQAQTLATSLQRVSGSEGETLHAEVLGLLGSARHDAGDLPGAIEALQQAALAARATGADALEAHVGATLLMLLAEVGRVDETDRWVPHVEGAAARSAAPIAIAEVEYALGSIAHRRLALGDARTRFERALATYEAALGRDTAAMRSPLDALARVELDDGHPERALPLFERALAIAAASWGLQHPESATIAINMAPLLAATGQAARAQDLLQQALAGQQRLLGPHHPTLALTHMQLGLVAFHLGDEARGVDELRACVDALREEPPSVTRANCRLNLAQVLTARGDCEDAEPLLRGVADDYGAIAKANEHDREIAITRLTEAHCTLARDPAAAVRLLEQAESLARALDDREMVAEIEALRAAARGDAPG
ncbi:MAG: protein kinase [Nannocystaceae bacterium]|nr:protein kinase [Nannocystaceae bacterium]